MTKDSIGKILANNRRPIAVHQLWAGFEQEKRTLVAKQEREIAWRRGALEKITRLPTDRLDAAVALATEALGTFNINPNRSHTASST